MVLKSIRKCQVILVWVLVAGFLSFWPNQIQAAESPASYLIINQIRGNECCSPGSVEALREQLAAVTTNKLSAYFALRYDALIDPLYRDQIKAAQNQNPQIKPALLLEITPGLAQAAGVDYPGLPENWYQAQQAYTIGYAPEDRRKLIDQAVQTYQSVFGVTPEVTSTWMIDTDSVNYLHDTYGVKVHQITREQWGLDSYTLYGGPFHFPYPASRNWLFMPDFNQPEATMIVRQTVMDPLLVYGDTSSAFTSQPNDYSLDAKDFGYFERLVGQALTTGSQPGFVLLGLENSMAENHQQEFARQLSWLAKQVSEGKAVESTPTTIREAFSQEKPRLVQANDVTQKSADQAWWVTTAKYRVRLLQQNNQMAMTDIRLYDSQLSDPYAEYQAQQNGYWVAPFIIDTSLNHDQKQSRNWWKKWLLPPEVKSSHFEIISDTDLEPIGLRLPQRATGAELQAATTDGRVKLSYQTIDQQTITILFANDRITIEGLSSKAWEVLTNSVHGNSLYPIEVKSNGSKKEIQWLVDGKISHRLFLDKDNLQVTMQFGLDPALWTTVRDRYRYYFFPEAKLVTSPDPATTVFYVNNRYAIANRNPVRLVVAPKDEQGSPVGLTTPIAVTVTPESSLAQENAMPVISDTTAIKSDDVQFVDISYGYPGALIADIQIGSALQRQEKIYLAPDCVQTPTTCLRHPRQASWYVRAKIGEWWREKSMLW